MEAGEEEEVVEELEEGRRKRKNERDGKGKESCCIIKLFYWLCGMTEHKGRCLDTGSTSSTRGIQWVALFSRLLTC